MLTGATSCWLVWAITPIVLFGVSLSPAVLEYHHFIGSAACKLSKGKKKKPKKLRKKEEKTKIRQVDSDLASTETSGEEEASNSDSVGRVIEEVAAAKSEQGD